MGSEVVEQGKTGKRGCRRSFKVTRKVGDEAGRNGCAFFGGSNSRVEDTVFLLEVRVRTGYGGVTAVGLKAEHFPSSFCS